MTGNVKIDKLFYTYTALNVYTKHFLQSMLQFYLYFGGQVWFPIKFLGNMESLYSCLKKYMHILKRLVLLIVYGQCEAGVLEIDTSDCTEYYSCDTAES